MLIVALVVAVHAAFALIGAIGAICFFMLARI
ncbi:hypothetical protein P368_15105 [Comamonas thiooxydans]|nr:hypothetical protein P369_17545 [Comamonas thiooxydans]KGG99546.1 hypothetical protein P367_10540 [Comamonas thiooxydans]KGH03979.1 hypothetical protein P365_16445 [Comamonas thiooxydans]KGH11347.1 hypothetical protein P368_15105 [Comamonas thiooxydans]